MTTETREQLIGALTIVVLVALMGFLNQGRDVQASGNGGAQVEALFGRIDGLRPGSEVRMGGIQIGKVTAQRLNKQFQAVVSMEFQPGVVVPKDSSASVQTDGLFGGKFIVIEPGVEDDALASGDRITDTQDAQVVSDLLDLIISEGRAALEARKQAGK